MRIDDEPDFIPEAIEETIPIIETASTAVQSADRETFMTMVMNSHMIVQIQDIRRHGNVIFVKGVL